MWPSQFAATTPKAPKGLENWSAYQIPGDRGGSDQNHGDGKSRWWCPTSVVANEPVKGWCPTSLATSPGWKPTLQLAVGETFPMRSKTKKSIWFLNGGVVLHYPVMAHDTWNMNLCPSPVVAAHPQWLRSAAHNLNLYRGRDVAIKAIKQLDPRAPLYTTAGSIASRNEEWLWWGYHSGLTLGWPPHISQRFMTVPTWMTTPISVKGSWHFITTSASEIHEIGSFTISQGPI